MQTIRYNSALLDDPDDEVWDRVNGLAPRSAPVRTGLFRESANRTFDHGPTSSELIRAEPMSQDSKVSLSHSWERYPVATVRNASAQPMHLRSASTQQPGVDGLAFDLLRTRLLQVFATSALTSVAVTAPSPGCGTTFTATNLALSLARLPGCRTLLIDLNFRSPGVADALNLVPTGSLRQGLLGNAPLTQSLARFGANLMVGLADGVQPDPAELLMDLRTTATLARLKQALKPDVIVFDLPPMLAYDDATAMLPQVDGVLLVTDGTKTVAGQIRQCQDILADQTQLLGVVLNKARNGAAAGLRYSDA